jgi:hypothetical protein
MVGSNQCLSAWNPEKDTVAGTRLEDWALSLFLWVAPGSEPCPRSNVVSKDIRKSGYYQDGANADHRPTE